jgi:glyoxylase-like metal-dependent hydrolase (beta-lactamase superfamily II)
MANVLQLTFNPFQENTYLIYDDTQECIILDPGCSSSEEQAELVEFASNLRQALRILLGSEQQEE